MKTEFTKGEWLVNGTEVYVTDGYETQVQIADTSYDEEMFIEGEAEANAKLIAAAPAMLKALQEIKAYYERMNKKNTPVISPHYENMISQAINKATA